MGSVYREISPSEALSPYIECFWTGEVAQNFSARVMPDGCADVLFISRRKELVDLQFVGVMTRSRVVQVPTGTLLLGIRFQPGMANACLDCDLQSLNDQVIPLRSLSDSLANDLAQTFTSYSCVEARVGAIEARLNSLPSINKVQMAIGALVGRKGRLTLDDFADIAGISARQLRRACRKYSGLAPKHIARILRLRHAVGQLRSGTQNMPELAYDCGYCDQAHMIRDFRELAGISPGHYLRQHSG